MKIGVPKEIKIHEYRVGLVPSGVRELIAHGHEVFIEASAGGGIGLSDEDYVKAGAKILPDADAVFATADMIIKVKEPQPVEIARLRPNHTLFTYLHLAPDPEQAQGLLKSGCVAIAYETVTSDRGSLPLLAPMSEVAGRMSIQVGAHCLEKAQGGSGVLLGGVPGVPAAKVVVLGGGVSGTHAARMAVGMGAHVTIIDRSLDRLKALDELFGATAATVFATQAAIEEHVVAADLVIGAVLVAGAAAPKLVTKAMLKKMRPGSVLVDISIDQGGCFETSHATSHDNPTYVVDDIVHYCVANMPGAVARTSAMALTNATLPFALAIADEGWHNAVKRDAHLRRGVNICKGKVTHEAVAKALGLDYHPLDGFAS
jgi:alanine dehydrogenase